MQITVKQFVQKGHDDSCARGAEWVAQGNAPAVHVELR